MRKISRIDMSVMIEISVSHLEKSESGVRRPGIDTYWKILDVLKVDIVIRNEMKTIQEQCAMKVQRILLNSTETQALLLLPISSDLKLIWLIVTGSTNIMTNAPVSQNDKDLVMKVISDRNN